MLWTRDPVIEGLCARELSCFLTTPVMQSMLVAKRQTGNAGPLERSKPARSSWRCWRLAGIIAGLTTEGSAVDERASELFVKEARESQFDCDKSKTARRL
jgi:hypothetical protein